MNNIRFYITSLCFMLLAAATQAAAPSVVVTSAQGAEAPIEIAAESSTGLQKIFVISDAAGASAVIDAGGASISVATFGSAGATYATPAATTPQPDGTVAVSLPATDTGLAIEVAGDRSYYYWIVDYSEHELTLNSLTIDPNESDCSMAALLFDGSAGPITFYTITGAPKTLSRDLELSWTSLAFDSDSESFQQVSKSSTIASIASTIHVEQPLCSTHFTLQGDRFTSAWGNRLSVESPVVDPIAVSGHATMTRLDSIADNMSNSGADNGPAQLQFQALVTDAVRFTEWQTSAYPDFSIIDLRFNQTDFDLDIDESGTTYIRFVAANDAGSCEWVSETFEVNIGASKLLCPNAFSPGDQNGVNDIWKVSYSSLTSFECNIFNRWGVHIIKLTDPSQGWDGRYRGKLVESGVYYYVIRARGTDGVDYKLSGDINVINYSIRSKNSTTE